MSAGPDVAIRELVSVDPATLETLGHVEITPPEELAEIIAEARLAQAAFAREPLERRSALLRRVVHALVEDADAIARSVSLESGKPLAEAYAHDLVVSADACRWHADNLGRVLREERVGFPQLVLRQKRGALRYEPLGVVGVVTPWNYPLAIPLRQVAAAVAAGNAAIVKPSELTPLTGALVEELFRRAGAPAGLVRVVQGGGEVGESLVRHRGIAAVVFTGSVEVGRSVARAAADRLCPVVLELGGKDAMLVLDDADLERAVEGALWGTFANCGQACAGIERIAVAPGLHDAFVERLADGARTLRIGRGTDDDVDLGPLVSESQRARFEGLVADAVEHGAHVAAGGRRPTTDLPGWFYEPTLLLGEPAAARLSSEELFGPGAVVVSIDNDREMAHWANDSPFGLGASVWSRDATRARAVAERLETGMVWHNDHAYSFGASQTPWGGRRGSGLGRIGSRHGLYALSHQKFVDTDRGRLTPGWWYPYGDAPSTVSRGCSGRSMPTVSVRAPARSSSTVGAWPTSCGRPSDERALARRRVDRRGADGRRGAQAADAPSRGGAGPRPDGAVDGLATARAPEGRRAGRRTDRRHPGGEADSRAHPALPSAPADARRGRPDGRRRRRRDRGRCRDRRADGCRDGGAQRRRGRRTDRVRHGEGDRQGDAHRRHRARLEDEGAGLSAIAAPLPVRLARLVRLEHTVFALPFAYVGALLSVDGWPGLGPMAWITVAMVGARTLAMGLNRLVDAEIDARNPRTAARELPSGALTPAHVAALCGLALVVYVVAVLQLDPIVRWLCPIPVVMFVVYPYLKRVTWLCHLWLGACLGLAPVGAWVAITGALPWEAWALGGAVCLWVAGFDLFYALFDRDHDLAEGLHSWATRFGVRGVFRGARAMHAGSVALLAAAGAGLDAGVWYWLGVAVVGALLVYEHAIVRPDDLRRLDAAFFTVNGVLSITFAVFVALDTLL